VDRGGQSPKEDNRAILTEKDCHMMALKPQLYQQLIRDAPKEKKGGRQLMEFGEYQDYLRS
jgi:hypothetical protein